MFGGMAKKLFEVVWSGRCFVMAESATEAECVAVDAVQDDGVGEGVGLEAFPREWGKSEAPREWENAIPWGSDDDRTVGEILRAERDARSGEAEVGNG
jgi:hypothetical protein